MAGREKAEIRIFLCGDVMTGRGVDQILPHPSDPKLHERWMGSALDYVGLAERRCGRIPRGVGFDYVWGDVLEALARDPPDVRIINLETSITRCDDAAPKGINYRMSPENAEVLAAAGIDCCTLANNHVLDWGRRGLIDTLESLDRAAIARAGAGRDLAEARAPAALEVPGKGRVLVFALAAESSGTPREWAAGDGRPGVNLAEVSTRSALELARAIRRARRPSDVVVVSIHWGPNWGYHVPEAHRAFAHALIREGGVSVVHGHSSHHPMGVEVFEGGLVLYGSGDFLNDYEGIGGREAFRSELVMGWSAAVAPADGRLRALEALPFRISRFRLNRLSEDDRRDARAILNRESARFRMRAEPVGEVLSFGWT